MLHNICFLTEVAPDDGGCANRKAISFKLKDLWPSDGGWGGRVCRGMAWQAESAAAAIEPAAGAPSCPLPVST